jgi:hypothetical protein
VEAAALLGDRATTGTGRTCLRGMTASVRFIAFEGAERGGGIAPTFTLTLVVDQPDFHVADFDAHDVAVVQ